MWNAENHSTWVEVDLQAIENNVRWLVTHNRAKVMAVVKANAYGHGAVPCAQAALRGGAEWCGVARIEEAVQLRQSGLECPILLLGYTPPGRLAEAISAQISIVVWDNAQVEQVEQAASQVGKPARLHLKVDTGMSRLGVQVDHASGLAKRIVEANNVLFEGVFTHFARADEIDPGPTNEQEQAFLILLDELDRARLIPPYIHATNSAASLSRPTTPYNLIRAGISLYGLHPSPDCLLPQDFRPALEWKSVLSQVKVLSKGRGISYGHTYITHKEERIGTLPVGYADGFRRIEGNQVLVSGRRVPVVGRVCMDQVMVQLDGVPDARPGEEVVLIGAQGEERITAEEVARRWGTINYEVVCGIGSRVPRIFR